MRHDLAATLPWTQARNDKKAFRKATSSSTLSLQPGTSGNSWQKAWKNEQPSPDKTRKERERERETQTDSLVSRRGRFCLAIGGAAAAAGFLAIRGMANPRVNARRILDHTLRSILDHTVPRRMCVMCLVAHAHPVHVSSSSSLPLR